MIRTLGTHLSRICSQVYIILATLLKCNIISYYSFVVGGKCDLHMRVKQIFTGEILLKNSRTICLMHLCNFLFTTLPICRQGNIKERQIAFFITLYISKKSKNSSRLLWWKLVYKISKIYFATLLKKKKILQKSPIISYGIGGKANSLLKNKQ